MPNPIILTVDDEPQVLNAIERDLRRHYGRDYRILKAGSGEEALETVQQLQLRNDPVALFLADQRMPHMSGTEFLPRPGNHTRRPERSCSRRMQTPKPPSPASTTLGWITT